MMPEPVVHDQGYRRYAGRRQPHGRSWVVIARQHIIANLRQRRFLALFLAGFIPLLGFSIAIWISETFRLQALRTTSGTFRMFIGFQSLFVFAISIALAGLIADDRRANALQVYLSKPLTRVEYVAGKLGTVLAFLLGVTLLPTLVLLLVQLLLAGSATFVRANLFLLPAIVLFSMVESITSGIGLLALSSLSNSRRFVALMYAGAVLFTKAMYQALRMITGANLWALISPSDTLAVIADSVFRTPAPVRVPVALAAVVVAVLIAASLLVLERRVRGVEVVQ